MAGRRGAIGGWRACLGLALVLVALTSGCGHEPPRKKAFRLESQVQVPGEPLRATFSRANDYLDVDLGPGPGYGPLAKFHRADVRVTKDAYVVTAWVRRERSLRGSEHLDGYMMTGRIRLPGPIGDRAVIDASGRKRIVVPPDSREALRRLVRKYRMTDARAGVD